MDQKLNPLKAPKVASPPHSPNNGVAHEKGAAALQGEKMPTMTLQD
jgi:hypothetical protein